MSIQAEITRLTQAKSDIKGALDRLAVAYEENKLDALALAVKNIPEASVTQEGGTLKISSGYVPEDLEYSVSGESISVGYLINNGGSSLSFQEITSVSGELQLSGSPQEVNSVSIPNTEPLIDLPAYESCSGSSEGSGFNLVKVTSYTPSREELTAPTQIEISGIGIIGSEDDGWYLDGSVANGTYIVTDETRYKQGMKRIYKQAGGNYYLACYDPSDYTHPDFNAHWFISTSLTGYGWNAVLAYYAEDIPSGTNSWSSEVYYTSTNVTTTITTETIPALTETITASAVTAFDDETDTWTVSDAAAVSDYTVTPQVDGIYFVQDGKLIGQHINKELTIPTDGLVRRFKAVDGHFVDTIWGTEMLPSGDISYDELGYAGNNAAPFGNGSSYLSANNTLTLANETTISAFFKYMGGTSIIFGLGDKSNHTVVGIYGNGIEVGGQGQSYFDLGLKLGRWNHVLMTVKKDPTTTANVEANMWCNGKLVKTITNTYGNYIGSPPHIGVLSNRSCSQYSETSSGQIDEACIWNRILTDDEISEMAKGVQTVDWDVEVPEYVQQQPVFYAPLTDDSKYCSTGQQIYINGSGDDTDISTTGYWRDGAFWNYKTNADGSLEYANMASGGNHSSFYTSGSYTVCVDVYYEEHLSNWQSHRINIPVLSYAHAPVAAGVQLYNVAGSDTVYARFKTIDGTVEVPKSTWTTIIARSTNGTLELFTAGELNGSGTVTEPYPFGNYESVVGPYILENTTYCKGAIRNIRLYNRAITDAEIAELSGITS